MARRFLYLDAVWTLGEYRNLAVLQVRQGRNGDQDSKCAKYVDRIIFCGAIQNG
jgi:hypothetical protein